MACWMVSMASRRRFRSRSRAREVHPSRLVMVSSGSGDQKSMVRSWLVRRAVVAESAVAKVRRSESAFMASPGMCQYRWLTSTSACRRMGRPGLRCVDATAGVNEARPARATAPSATLSVSPRARRSMLRTSVAKVQSMVWPAMLPSACREKSARRLAEVASTWALPSARLALSLMSLSCCPFTTALWSVMSASAAVEVAKGSSPWPESVAEASMSRRPLSGRIVWMGKRSR